MLVLKFALDFWHKGQQGYVLVLKSALVAFCQLVYMQSHASHIGLPEVANNFIVGVLVGFEG